MTRNGKAAARRLAAGVAAILLLTLALPPAMAEPVSGTAPTGSPQRPQSIAAAVAAKLARMDTSRAVRMAQDPVTTGSADEGRSFLRSRRGVAVVALMVVGVGWVVYSTQHDDVKRSPLR